MENDYFIIDCSEGEPSVRKLTKDQLTRQLNENEVDTSSFMESLESTDMNYWGYKKLIIKGHVVTPTLKKIVTEIDID